MQIIVGLLELPQSQDQTGRSIYLNSRIYFRDKTASDNRSGLHQFSCCHPFDVSGVKAAECYSENGIVVAHDKINRYLKRQSLTPETLWNEVERFIEKRTGWLIPADPVLDKIYSEQIELTCYQWSGKHHKIVKGIGLISLVRTDGGNTFPAGYRIHNKDGDERSKNDHFRDMVKTASDRGFQPYFVMFDSWYSGIVNLKMHRYNWLELVFRIKKNRMVNLDKTGNRPVLYLSIPDDRMTVHMKTYGFVQVFHTVNKDGRNRFWASNFPAMDSQDRINLQAIC